MNYSPLLILGVGLLSFLCGFVFNNYNSAMIVKCEVNHPRPSAVAEEIERVVYTDVDCSQAPSLPKRVHSNICDIVRKKDRRVRSKLHLWKGDTATTIFGHLHNPASPSKHNILLTDSMNGFMNFNSSCESIYLTRTGSRANQPNKCVAVVKVAPKHASLQQHSHRVGYTALLTNQYQADYARQPRCYNEEKLLLPPLLSHLDILDKEFKRKMGNPLSGDGEKRRTAIIMVANDGVIDLLLNFLCSLYQVPSVSLKDILVYVGTSDFIPLIENMGANAIYHEALGSMPKHAAGGYLDKTFSRMMWFKTTSVYLAIRNGFNVLFQDVDLVWTKDPIRYFEKLHASMMIEEKNEKENTIEISPGDKDVSFMDDGARTPRYTPFFVNSGFFYVKYNDRTRYFQEKMMKCSASEIGYSHSHQSVMIKHLAETHHLFGMQIYVLDRDLFPSGQAYHERKKYVQKITQQEYRPFVFHMCWTSNRVDKVKYFKEMKLWYVKDSQICRSNENMKRMVQQWSASSRKYNDIKDLCCSRSNAWAPEVV